MSFSKNGFKKHYRYNITATTQHETRLRRILALLEVTETIEDMDLLLWELRKILD
jgi:hypothetical protein